MYSLLPAIVSVLFLAFGICVLIARGANRVSAAFFLLCFVTFSWQLTWSILFQVEPEHLALSLARLGYALILFLPTTMYWVAVELTRDAKERIWVALSTAAALALALSGQVVGGVYHYHFGFYPKAGPLHWVHLLQTGLVVARAIYLLWRAQGRALSVERVRLRYCLASMMTYTLAAIDYACNYGLDIYPPGVLFIVLSLGMVAQAIARHQLAVNPMQIAASVVHEMRTPLAAISGQARLLAKGLPDLIAGYESALAQGHPVTQLHPATLDYMRALAAEIEAEVSRTNFIADSVLASAQDAAFARAGFTSISVRQCIDEAVRSYPFDGAERERIAVEEGDDFQFHGSSRLMVLVLYNLIKNGLQAGGQIAISFGERAGTPTLTVRDTGHGIPPHVLPHVFDTYFTTRSNGSGMGLAFCRRVMQAFLGQIAADSVPGQGSVFTLRFPPIR